VPENHPLASVRGAFNAVVVESEAAGRLMFYGQGAGGAPTASAVLSDVVAAASHVVLGGRAPRESAYAALPILPPANQAVTARFTIEIEDRPGMLASVAGVLAEEGISIDSVRQAPHVEPAEGADGPRTAHLTITTHRTWEDALSTCLTRLADVAGVRAVLTARRIEGV
jgi:homoserine dehydrogenase